jgi:hypothetical protein
LMLFNLIKKSFDAKLFLSIILTLLRHKSPGI